MVTKNSNLEAKMTFLNIGNNTGWLIDGENEI